MEEYPKTLLEFEQQFSTEEACCEYIFKIRWPDGFRCPKCQHNKVWKTQRNLFQCSKCGYQNSITAGTIFQDTSKPLQLWFRAIWHVVGQKNGVNALGLQKELGPGSYRTAWTWLHKLRCAMVRPGRERLSGTVEVDEAYIGSPAPGKSAPRLKNKAVILVAAEQDGTKIGRIRLCQISNAQTETLNEAIPKMIESGTVICTDGWSGYRQIEDLGYRHKIVKDQDVPNENLLPRVNVIVALLKRWLLGTHQDAVRRSHLDYYLDEFVFHFNRRTSKSRGKLFYRMIQQAVQIDPVLNKSLSRKHKNHENA